MAAIRGYNQGESPKDHVYFNKSLVTNWQQYKEDKKEAVVDEATMRAMLAKQRKDEMEEERRRRNLFQLYKWDFVRQKVTV